MSDPLDWPLALIRLAHLAATPGATVEPTPDGGGRVIRADGRVVEVGRPMWRTWGEGR